MYFRITFYFFVFLVFMLVPTDRVENSRSLCIIYNLFGKRCPGCGMTRAFSNIFHANFARAFEYNKLIAVVFPLFALICTNDIWVIGKRVLLKNQPLNEDCKLSLFERILLKIYETKS